MAWPKTPLTTYVADNAPAIKAADLNSLQDATNQIINGTYTLQAVVVDGTGGSAVVPVNGTSKVSAMLTETAVPGTARDSGLDCVGTRVWGWVNFTGAGVLKRGYNVKAFSRTGVGLYTVEFYGAPADPDFCYVGGTAIAAGTACIVTVKPYLSGGGTLAADIAIYDSAGALVDAAACVEAKAE